LSAKLPACLPKSVKFTAALVPLWARIPKLNRDPLVDAIRHSHLAVHKLRGHHEISAPTISTSGGGCCCAPAISRSARAQTYPSRPVLILAGFCRCGGIDMSARLMGQWLSERLGQPFVIENRPGANSNIATEAVVYAPRTAIRCS